MLIMEQVAIPKKKKKKNPYFNEVILKRKLSYNSKILL